MGRWIEEYGFEGGRPQRLTEALLRN